ncbi:MAG: MmgE/PrpD family protein [Burkholderiales bacterium]
MTFVKDELAALAHGIRYSELPPEVVLEAKRVILDTLACAAGALRSEPAAIVKLVAGELGGNAKATTIGDGGKTSCALATLVNGTLIRYLDNNDYYFGLDSAHPSGNLAPALAVAEKCGRTGRDVIAALVAAYEVQLRLCDVVAATGITARGWHPGTDMQFSSAAVAGLLMSDDARVTAHAMAIAGSHNNTLAQSQRGHIPMMKATAEATIAKGGVEAALLAAAGLTGPEEIFEGVAGWGKTVAGDVDFSALTAPVGERYRILDTCLKPYAAVAGAMAPIRAAIDIATHERLVTAEIAGVVIKLHASAVTKATDPRKNYPRDKETADHSYHYCIAAALLDGACGPAQFTDARIASADIRGLIAKTTLAADDELTALWPQSSGGGVVVTMRDGRTIARMNKHPPGHPRNPLTNAEIERKFFELADGILPVARVEQIIEEVGTFEQCESIGELLGHMKMQ